MKIHLTIDEQYEETEIHIYAKEYSEALEKIMQQLKVVRSPELIDGYVGQEIHMLKVADVFTVFAEGAKVYLQTDEQEFEAKKKLYEIEELLAKDFVRVSKSTLVNVKKISSIQLGLLGTTQVLLENNVSVPISRKYMKQLKQQLGIGRD